jgi:hypothetical protein
MPESIPPRASDAGPEPSGLNDWRDHLDFAGDYIRKASRAEPEVGQTPISRSKARRKYIDDAIEALIAAKELLCQESIS